MTRSGAAAAVSMGMLVALATGLTAGVLLTRTDVPVDLRKSEEIGLSTVSERSYEDARTVTVVVSGDEPQELMSPREGRVSATRCAPGTIVHSGEQVFALDGSGLLALAASVPPWRDLTLGDRGADAAALNTELARLGYNAPGSDRITNATVRAFGAVARDADIAVADASVISVSSILWLPTEQVTISQCPVQLGDAVAVGDPVLVLQTVPYAQVASVPPDAVAGARALRVDGEMIVPVEDDGRVASSEGIAALLASDAHATASVDEQGARQLSLTWFLAEPARVWVTAPSALAGEDSEVMCLVGPDQAIFPVRVVGSELGQTFVVPEPEVHIPDQVQMSPAASVSCG